MGKETLSDKIVNKLDKLNDQLKTNKISKWVLILINDKRDKKKINFDEELSNILSLKK